MTSRRSHERLVGEAEEQVIGLLAVLILLGVFSVPKRLDEAAEIEVRAIVLATVGHRRCRRRAGERLEVVDPGVECYSRSIFLLFLRGGILPVVTAKVAFSICLCICFCRCGRR